MSDVEKYLDWLERCDIPVEETTTIKDFQTYLKDELGITGEAQISGLWEATGTKWSLADVGVRAMPITYPWGHETRYVIEGYKGLFGFPRMKEITGWKP